MKAEISQRGLADIISWAMAAVPPRADASSPSLGGVRLEAADGTLTAAAYDRRVARRWSAPAQTGEPGVALPPARVLAGITDRLPAKPVELETDESENFLVLTCGAARYTVPLLDAVAYPEVPAMPAPECSFDGPALVRAVERAVVAADIDHVELARTVVRFEPHPEKGVMILVATDKFRISVAGVPCMAGADMPPVHVPAGALRDWARAMRSGCGAKVTLGFTRDQQGRPLTAGLADGSRQTSVRLTGLEEYLKWQNFASLPAGDFLAAEVDTQGLAAAIRPLAALIPDMAPLYVTFTSGEVLLATSRLSGRASGADSFPVAYDGPRIQMAFRPGFLEEALTATGGTATMIMTKPGKAVFLTPVTESGKKRKENAGDESFLHVVMPISSPVEPPPE